MQRLLTFHFLIRPKEFQKFDTKKNILQRILKVFGFGLMRIGIDLGANPIGWWFCQTNADGQIKNTQMVEYGHSLMGEMQRQKHFWLLLAATLDPLFKEQL